MLQSLLRLSRARGTKHETKLIFIDWLTLVDVKTFLNSIFEPIVCAGRKRMVC